MYSPTLESFTELAKQGNLIPVTRRILADFETPLSAYHKIRGQGESFLFESVEGGEHLGRYSFVGCNPRAIIRQTGDRVEVIENGKVIEKFAIREARPDCSQCVHDGLEVVERIMKRYRAVSIPGLPRFTGGAVGFIGYEFIHDVEPVVPRPAKDELKTPTMYFLIADELLIFDRVAQTVTILVNAILEEGVTPADSYENAVAEVDRLVSLLEQPSNYKPVTVPTDVPSLPFESNVTKEKFMANVLKAKEYIRAGDIIQVVGSQRFSTPVKAAPIDIYRAARSINPSPYMFLLELDGFSLVGASPELHVRCEDHKVEIRPIAGTRPRGKTDEQDLKNEKDLLADPKERAEHVMLVDLARNDLGRVCDYGTVQVKDLMVIERYSHVMHIVSQVEGNLSASKTPYDLMRATFPAGTLSGAPKVRAMQIISELEQTQRGTYGGCVGYFSFNGNLDCCITIRTALIKDGKAYVQAGGGWVNDSTPEGEFDETVNKSKAMLKAVALAESFTQK
ncbi:anthranilate synthase component I [Pedosphaera parvula]|uniref:Anthranilate synthase component 1 n=1 Tax=Pedosphaera parvula (strain Ellin514) TaxID=320771 RepID=B9XMF6_PEDPL|nr:anthranilate synthase component I [Pedosphaera parvula]EEF58998.1 anthranilate synthase component I [Pedosphaera parvula Ellin514]